MGERAVGRVTVEAMFTAKKDDCIHHTGAWTFHAQCTDYRRSTHL